MAVACDSPWAMVAARVPSSPESSNTAVPSPFFDGLLPETAAFSYVSMEEPPQIRTIPRSTCPLCEGRGVELHGNLRDVLYGAPGCWGFLRCENPRCRLIWLHPTPVRQDIGLAYRCYFTHPESFESPGLSARLRSRLYAGYQCLLRGLDSLFGLGSARDALERRHLDPRSRGRLLDVGCGDGSFLYRMQQQGWQVTGIDLDPQAIAAARQRYGLELVVGDLLSPLCAPGLFAAVTMSHGMRHLLDPRETLNEVLRIIRPAGFLVLVPPNPDSMGHQRHGAHWFGLDPPRHLHLFPPATLRALVEQAGFRVVALETTAVHADIFWGASRSIREARRHHRIGPLPQKVRPLRALRAALERYYEHVQLRRHPLAGEETVLVARSDAP